MKKKQKQIYQTITIEQIEKAIKEHFDKPVNPNTRRVKIICWEAGFKMFSDALKKEAEKYGKSTK